MLINKKHALLICLVIVLVSGILLLNALSKLPKWILIATPNGGLFDTMSFYHADVVDGKVRILVRSNFDGTTPATSTTWAVIVFHK